MLSHHPQGGKRRSHRVNKPHGGEWLSGGGGGGVGGRKLRVERSEWRDGVISVQNKTKDLFTGISQRGEASYILSPGGTLGVEPEWREVWSGEVELEKCVSAVWRVQGFSFGACDSPREGKWTLGTDLDKIESKETWADRKEAGCKLKKWLGRRED